MDFQNVGHWDSKVKLIEKVVVNLSCSLIIAPSVTPTVVETGLFVKDSLLEC